MRLLVVDDNATARTILSQHTARLGPAVDCASDVVQGLQLMREASAKQSPYGFAILGRVMLGMAHDNHCDDRRCAENEQALAMWWSGDFRKPPDPAMDTRSSTDRRPLHAHPVASHQESGKMMTNHGS